MHRQDEERVKISNLSDSELSEGFTVEFNSKPFRRGKIKRINGKIVGRVGERQKRGSYRLTVRCIGRKSKQQCHYMVTEINLLSARKGSEKLWVGEGTIVIKKK